MKRRDKAIRSSDTLPADQPFVSRWSQRKHALAAGAQLDSPTEERTEGAAELSGQKELTDSDMPALGELDENSDYSMFLSPKVSEELRCLALRKLFRCAQFNVCDGLDDYAEDFTTFAALGDVLTADIRHRLKMQAEKALRSAADIANSDEVSPTDLRTTTADGNGDPAPIAGHDTSAVSADDTDIAPQEETPT
jgi:hypothetical protein